MPTLALSPLSASEHPNRQSLPLATARVAAGFPSPAEDHIEAGIDLNEWLIEHPAATFLVRIQGDSMTGAGILDGDVAVVDRAIEPRPGHVVIATIDGEFLVKRLARRGGRLVLACENPDFPTAAIDIDAAQEALIWGVVRHAIHTFRA